VLMSSTGMIEASWGFLKMTARTGAEPIA